MRRQSTTLATLSLVFLSLALSACGPAQVPVQALAADVAPAAYRPLAQAGRTSMQQADGQLPAQPARDQERASTLVAVTSEPPLAPTLLPSPIAAPPTPAATATLSPVPTLRRDPGTPTKVAPAATAASTATRAVGGQPATAPEAAPQMAPVSGAAVEPQQPASVAQAAANTAQVPAQEAPPVAAAGSSTSVESQQASTARSLPVGLESKIGVSGVPERIVAPSIKLDSKIVRVGWHDVTNLDGSTTSEWDVASYAVSWNKTSARLGQPGNTVLTGHNNEQGEVFRHLEHFKIGDPITIYSGGRAFEYTVTHKFIVQEKGVPYAQRLENAKWIGPFPDERVTLMSCWPYTDNTHRIFIIAKPARAG